MMASPEVVALLEQVRPAAESAGVFKAVELAGDRLVCHALNSAEPAEYRVDEQEGKVFVSLVTLDRWLSGSIESDLTHSGDSIEELIDEEMVDLGCEDGPLPVEHFRSEDMLYTFRSALPTGAGPETATAVLLAYETVFVQLGDMDVSEEE